MRKFFMAVAIVGLALLVASPAPALDFKFGAEYRIRFYDFVHYNISNTFTDVQGTNSRGIQSRVRPRFDVSDDNGNMTATLRLEIGDIEWGNGGGAHGVDNGVNVSGANGARVGNGSGGALGVDGVNVETKWAYVDFASPFGIPLRWRAGLQAWYLPKGIIMDDDAAGVRAYGTYGIVSYEAAWFRAEGGQCTNTTTPTSFPASAVARCDTGNANDNNLDYWQAKVDVNIAPWLAPSVYGIYGRNAAAASTTTVPAPAVAKPLDQWFVGVSLNGDLKFLKYDLDFLYGSQEGGNAGTFGTTAASTTVDPQKVKGWVVDGGVHIPVGPVLIHAVGSYATGDKADGGKSEAMPYISPSWNGAGGLYELIGSGGTFDVFDTQDYPAGLWMVGGGAEYRPVKALWLRAMYGYVGFTRASANCANVSANPCYGPSYVALAGKGQVGHDVELRADYDLWTNFKIQGMAGWIFPVKGDTAHKYILQLYYNF